MSIAGLVAWALLAVLIAFVGMALYATYRQVEDEARRAGRRP